MALYSYQGRDSSGKALSGELTATSRDQVASQLSGRGIIPIKIDLVEEKKDVLEGINKFLGANKVRDEDLIMLTRQLYTITKAGLPLVRGLKGLAQSIRHPVLNDVLARVAGDLETGMQLSSAMGKHPEVFNNLYVNMIKVGEDSGQLEAVFDQISVYMDRDLETRKSIQSALRYPMFVVIALAIAIGTVNVLVIPAFADMFGQFGADLPITTKILLAMSSFTVAYWPHILVVTIGGYIAFRNYVSTDSGAVWWGEKKLRIMVVGDIMERALMARYARSFALMLKSGVPISMALDLCSKAMDNAYVMKKIQQIKQGVERGDTLLSTHYGTGLFTPLILQMISVGEESGQVDTLLDEVAGFYEREVDYDLKTISDRIQPILTVVMAVFVLILAMGIFLPMWEMYNIQQ